MPLVSRTKPLYTPVKQNHLHLGPAFLKDVSRPDQVADVLAIFRGHVDRLFGIAPAISAPVTTFTNSHLEGAAGSLTPDQ